MQNLALYYAGIIGSNLIMAELRNGTTCKPRRIWICHYVRRSGMSYGALTPCFKNLSCIEIKILIYHCFISMDFIHYKNRN